jgi:succinate dehydrogenase flavin-adding protein (antitoxin of CptAB toxin-antitoxin module)
MDMGTSVLSLRIDHELLQRLRHQAAKRGMSVQDYVVRTLTRDDFDQRFQAAVEETERFYGSPDPGDEDQDQDQVRPSAGIR